MNAKCELIQQRQYKKKCETLQFKWKLAKLMCNRQMSWIILCTDDSQNGTVIVLMRLLLGSISVFQVLTFSTGALSTNAI